MCAAAAPVFAAVFPPLPASTAVEFHHASFDHFFITSAPDEIDALDSGRTVGWTRTGRAFAVFDAAATGRSPVCRFYIPPQHGNSHFFSASPAECQDILSRIPVDPNYSGYVYESPDAFYSVLPDTATGVCAAGSFPVHRLWNQRADSNHRYTTDPGIAAAMIAQGYVAEGYGPDPASMCTTAALIVDARTHASGRTGFVAGCEGVPPQGTAYVNAEVEPFIAVNPSNSNNMIGVWQQDRWSNGGARGLGTAVSHDGGGTWTRTTVPFSRCTGGNAGNGGDFERATDPWVSFAPDGTAFQSALAFNNQTNGDNAILVSRSVDGGRTWSDPFSVRSDGAQSFNDKEAITADPSDARYVYVVWDRLTGNHGPSWLARTTDGGASWEPSRVIYDPGTDGQTINNQIVVLGDGTLVNFFTELANVGPQNARLRLMRSADKGLTWSAPVTITNLQSVGTIDPETGAGIRDASGLGAIAAGKNGMLAVAWQDSRFSGGAHDDIAFSRSVDGGLTWSAPIRINGDPAAATFIPTVTIRDDGMIGVGYYDLRGNTDDPATLPTDTWLVWSADGTTWTERRVGETFDLAKAALAGGRYFVGDYAGMTHAGAVFLPFYGQTTADTGNRSDIVLSIAPVSATTTVATRQVKVGAMPVPPPTAEAAARAREAIRAAVRERLPDAVRKRIPGPTAEVE